jgi:hypothetical protein
MPSYRNQLPTAITDICHFLKDFNDSIITLLYYKTLNILKKGWNRKHTCKKRDLNPTIQYVHSFICSTSQPDDDPVGSKHVAA